MHHVSPGSWRREPASLSWAWLWAWLPGVSPSVPEVVWVFTEEGLVQPLDTLVCLQACDEELSSTCHPWESLALEFHCLLPGVTVSGAFSADVSIIVTLCADCPWNGIDFTCFLSSEEASITLLGCAISTEVTGGMCVDFGC